MHASALVLTLSTLLAPAAAPDPLPRRAFLGVQLGPPSEAGVPIEALVPGGSAGDAGVRAGDVLRRMDDVVIRTPGDLMGAMRTRRAGATVELTVRRDGEDRTFRVPLSPLPREVHPGHEVVYGSVPVEGGALRTIATRPVETASGGTPADSRSGKSAGVAPAKVQRLPAVFYLQGLACGTVESLPLTGPNAPPDSISPLIRALGAAGFVTFRVEKSGIGDSTGPACSEIDLQTELAGYRAGLDALKALPFVDPDRIVLLGHSAGGWMAPLLAAQAPVRGIVVYGTVGKTWLEYQLENHRRQLRLAGLSEADVDDSVRASARLFDEVMVEGRPPREAAADAPEIAAELAQVSADGVHFFGRSVEYFRDLAALNLGRAWSSLSARVYAVWGAADFVASRDDHVRIVGAVNLSRPGSATFEEVPRADHGMFVAESQQAAFAQPFAGPFHEEVARKIAAWATGVTKPS